MHARYVIQLHWNGSYKRRRRKRKHKDWRKISLRMRFTRVNWGKATADTIFQLVSSTAGKRCPFSLKQNGIKQKRSWEKSRFTYRWNDVQNGVKFYSLPNVPSSPFCSFKKFQLPFRVSGSKPNPEKNIN